MSKCVSVYVAENLWKLATNSIDSCVVHVCSVCPFSIFIYFSVSLSRFLALQHSSFTISFSSFLSIYLCVFVRAKQPFFPLPDADSYLFRRFNCTNAKFSSLNSSYLMGWHRASGEGKKRKMVTKVFIELGHRAHQFKSHDNNNHNKNGLCVYVRVCVIKYNACLKIVIYWRNFNQKMCLIIVPIER